MLKYLFGTVLTISASLISNEWNIISNTENRFASGGGAGERPGTR